jgi:4,5-dihydroxyphthalate decarboxylase
MVALGEYPHVNAVLNGDAKVDGYQVEPVEVRPIIGAYRRMIRNLEFDVCELAPTSWLMAREAGVRLTAIPVFLNRRFHHGDVQCADNSGIQVPRDLEGRRVGARAYTVTTAVWVRGILAEEYGVDTSSITWVTDDEDHIEGHAPAGTERVTDGRSLGALLRAGELAAALSGNAGTGRAGPPRSGWTATTDDDADGPYPLFADADVLGADWYLRSGIYPLHSVIAVKTELVEQDPDLPSALYAAFAESKRQHVATDPAWNAVPRLARQGRQVNGDPIPYGVEANGASLRALVRFSADQGLLDAAPEPEALFAAGDYPTA